MSKSSEIVITDINGFVRPASKAVRAPPGGRSSIIFGDEEPASSRFTTTARIASDSNDCVRTPDRPNRRGSVDRTSIRNVLEQEHVVHDTAPRRVRCSPGGVTSIQNLI